MLASKNYRNRVPDNVLERAIDALIDCGDVLPFTNVARYHGIDPKTLKRALQNFIDIGTVRNSNRAAITGRPRVLDDDFIPVRAVKSAAEGPF